MEKNKLNSKNKLKLLRKNETENEALAKQNNDENDNQKTN